MNTIPTTRKNGGNEIIAHELFCKLSALAALIGSLGNQCTTLNANEYYGIELMLNEIADEINGGAA